VGCWKGFKELELLSYSTKLPHMVGIQAEGCAPIVKAFKEKSVDVSAWEQSSTIASAIADPLIGYAQDGTYTLNKIRESDGSAEACSDKDILESVTLLAKKEGIFAEPAGASSLAGAMKMFEEGKIDRDEIVVCLVTGTGLKQMISDSNRKSIVIDPDFTKFTQLMDRGTISV
jgi:threonine synthase